MILTSNANLSPCDRDCPKRSAECHAKCPEYASYRKWMDECAEKRYKKTYLHTPDLPRAMKKHIWRGMKGK